jgi:DNA-binding transcriptional LysR family regulator
MDTLDPDLLRTFLAFVDGGTLAKAAATVGRSPSAVTAQMQRLEEIVGEPLLAQQGRGRGLTLAGEELVGHARRILATHREAWLALKGARADGRVVIGTTQDFADSGLPELLRDFARTHPRVRLELRVGRTAELVQAFSEDTLDIAITMRRQPLGEEVGVIVEPMAWLIAEQGLAARQEELPLALLDPPCGFRETAVAALDAASRAYRVAATSASLAGLRAAVEAGIALTLRTGRWAHSGIVEAGQDMGLPAVPTAEFAIRLRSGAGRSSADLADLLANGLPAERTGKKKSRP